MISHIDDLPDLRNGVFEDPLDALPKGDGSHTATLAAPHEPQVNVGAFNADQFGGPAVTGDGGVHVAGQHLSHLVGQGPSQVAYRPVTDGRTGTIGIVHRQALGGEVQRSSSKVLDVTLWYGDDEITMPVEMVGRLAITQRHKTQLVGELSFPDAGHLDEKRELFVPWFLIADLDDLLAGSVRNGQNVFVGHAASVEMAC